MIKKLLMICILLTVLFQNTNQQDFSLINSLITSLTPSMNFSYSNKKNKRIII